MDFQATTPMDPRVLDAMLPYQVNYYGNPHSRTHAYGWESERAMEHAREQVANLIGADPREIVFTSGATESNNMSIKPRYGPASPGTALPAPVRTCQPRYVPTEPRYGATEPRYGAPVRPYRAPVRRYQARYGPTEPRYGALVRTYQPRYGPTEPRYGLTEPRYCATKARPYRAPVRNPGTALPAPVRPYRAPVRPYRAPVRPYRAPVRRYRAPVRSPGTAIPAPVRRYRAPVQPYRAPVQPYRAPVRRTTQTEHKCVLDSCRVLDAEGFSVTYLPVKPNGLPAPRYQPRDQIFIKQTSVVLDRYGPTEPRYGATEPRRDVRLLPVESILVIRSETPEQYYYQY
ncbi:hypothetical protein CRUP_032256 [Coryphaenoides rupestris]|nr:hypothetical protein CRUP_032256 [Coryphaenoides rupestris]